MITLLLISLLALPEPDGGNGPETFGESIRAAAPGIRVGTVSPFTGQDLTLRGINAVRSGSAPLYVIDGVPVNPGISLIYPPFGADATVEEYSPFAWISPEDIVSVEVLSDLTAVARYGTQGANGVILIKTRLPRADKDQVRLHSEAWTGLGYRGLGHSHYVSAGGGRGRSAYNLSAAFRQLRSRDDEDHQLSLKTDFLTGTDQGLSFGAHALLRYGKVRLDESIDAGKEYAGTGSVSLGVPLWKNRLRWTTDAGVDFRSTERFLWYGEDTPLGAAVNGAAAVLSTTLMSYSVRSGVAFDSFLAVDHHLSAFLGGEALGERNQYHTLSGTDFFTRELAAQGLSLMAGEKHPHRYLLAGSHLDAVAELAYSYRQYAGLETALRYDYAGRFGEGRLYPSASAWAQWGPVRAEGGWALAGRSTVMPYDYVPLYVPGEILSVDAGGAPYYTGQDALLSREWHTGIRAGLWKDILSLEVKYYDKRTEERFRMYTEGVRGNQFWFGAPLEIAQERLAVLHNRGIETSLRAGRDGVTVRWQTALHFAWNLGSLSAPDEAGFFGMTAGAVAGFRTGEDGLPVDVNRDGRISDADRVILGDAIPPFSAAWSGKVSFKGFSLELVMDGAFGSDRIDRQTFDAFRLDRAALGYTVPVKGLRLLEVKLSALNPAWAGWKPYPVNRALTLGITAEF